MTKRALDPDHAAPAGGYRVEQQADGTHAVFNSGGGFIRGGWASHDRTGALRFARDLATADEQAGVPAPEAKPAAKPTPAEEEPWFLSEAGIRAYYMEQRAFEAERYREATKRIDANEIAQVDAFRKSRKGGDEA